VLDGELAVPCDLQPAIAGLMLVCGECWFLRTN